MTCQLQKAAKFNEIKKVCWDWHCFNDKPISEYNGFSYSNRVVDLMVHITYKQ
ncbi:hypothetical protein J0S82_000288 [Galemys pyrenaicus]|uniref:Uncharacterized protein n=1 Tax=Galemys pyrenaicus TaxID=202257 RepID=A0A8J6AJH5_GALPY|nr:hypothetical protein J0S82_000288 [Galemys pyrenaicus]